MPRTKKTAVQKAWARIRERYEAETQKQDAADAAGMYSWNDDDTPSINDLIQREYRAGRITEPERDAMREHVAFWLPDLWLPDYETGLVGATFACGMWAPSVGPMGTIEHGIILSTVVILEEEAA